MLFGHGQFADAGNQKVSGFAAQVVLFSDPVAERIGSLGVPIYVGSTVMVAAVVAANWRIR